VWDDYEADTELIGRGAFARVFRAIRRDDNSPVAIKVIGRETKAFAQQRRGEHQLMPLLGIRQQKARPGLWVLIQGWLTKVCAEPGIPLTSQTPL
jgi:serine/threonine protein kinase